MAQRRTVRLRSKYIKYDRMVVAEDDDDHDDQVVVLEKDERDVDQWWSMPMSEHFGFVSWDEWLWHC
jgi:hypothetical protein